MYSFKKYLSNEEYLISETFDNLEFIEFFEENYPEFAVLFEKARSDYSGSQSWGPLPKPEKNTDIKTTLNSFIKDKVYPISMQDKKAYDRALKLVANALDGAKAITVDLKPIKSIESKVLERGRSIESVTDIVRGSLVVKSPEDIETARKLIKKNFKIYDEDVKELGGDKKFGYYGAVHYDVELPSGNVAEIQLLPRSLKHVKDAAHVVYTSERDKASKDPTFTSTTSKQLFGRGQGRKGRIAYGPNITKS